jgi:hypothetical protein
MPEAQIPYPPPEVFSNRTTTQNELNKSAAPANVVLRFEHPPTGGMFAVCEGLKYPVKGWVFPEAAMAVNNCKKLMLTLAYSLTRWPMMFAAVALGLVPWKKKIALADDWIEHLTWATDQLLLPYSLKDEFHMHVALEWRNLVFKFLCNLGIRESVAFRFASAICMIIEYDDAYRYRLEDIFSELDETALYANPRKELNRLAAIMGSREVRGDASKFGWIMKAVGAALLHPKVKKAFLDAFRGIHIENLKYDEADRYHCLRRDDYNHMGLTIEERWAEWYKIHGDDLPMSYKLPVS